jgi:hypothetical protein
MTTFSLRGASVGLDSNEGSKDSHSFDKIRAIESIPAYPMEAIDNNRLYDICQQN